MLKKLLQNITIYHREGTNWVRYNKKASVRTEINVNKDTTGTNSSENAIIRIFDIEGYNLSWKISKGDIIVPRETFTEIQSAPKTELRNLYGKDKVFEVNYIKENLYNEKNIKKLNHIHIGAN